MSEFDRLFNMGMKVASRYVQESFIYNGTTYNGILNGIKYGLFHISGGYKKIRNATLVVSTCVLKTLPVTGDLITVQGQELQVLAVWDETDTYTITLVEKSK